MTLSEFKYFIEGMDVQHQPSILQWKRILEKLETIDEDKKVYRRSDSDFRYPSSVTLPFIETIC